MWHWRAISPGMLQVITKLMVICSGTVHAVTIPQVGVCQSTCSEMNTSTSYFTVLYFFLLWGLILSSCPNLNLSFSLPSRFPLRACILPQSIPKMMKWQDKVAASVKSLIGA